MKTQASFRKPISGAETLAGTLPFFVAIGVALVITRLFRPLGRFFTNLGGDATQLSFAFYEIKDQYALPWMAMLSALMIDSAWPYMRRWTSLGGRQCWQQAWRCF